MKRLCPDCQPRRFLMQLQVAPETSVADRRSGYGSTWKKDDPNRARLVSKEKIRKPTSDSSIIVQLLWSSCSDYQSKRGCFQKFFDGLFNYCDVPGPPFADQMLFVEEDQWWVISSLTQQHLWMRTSRMFPWPKNPGDGGKIYREMLWMVGDVHCWPAFFFWESWNVSNDSFTILYPFSCSSRVELIYSIYAYNRIRHIWISMSIYTYECVRISDVISV